MTLDESNSNLSAVLYGAQDLRLEHRPMDDPKAGEVQIHVKATGICGSDFHYYHKGRLGPRILEKPMILGHESCGIITRVGADVTDFQVGDRVVIEPGHACGQCQLCLQGRYNLCSKMKFSSSLMNGVNHGTLREYVCFPWYLMPDSMTFEQGALIEPVAVAVHAVKRTPVEAGSSVIVIGAGPVGLLVAAVACAQGASHCLVMDIDQARLDFAQQYLPGIKTELLPVPPTTDALAWAEQQAVLLQLSADSIDVVFECTGAETSICLAMHTVRRGGVVMLIGMGTVQCVMPIDLVLTREIDVKGNFRYAQAHHEAIALVANGRVSTKGLVTHRFALEQAAEAFEQAKHAIKVHITS
ncbi:GroES-like protein [Mucor lusitanicus]